MSQKVARIKLIFRLNFSICEIEGLKNLFLKIEGFGQIPQTITNRTTDIANICTGFESVQPVLQN